MASSTYSFDEFEMLEERPSPPLPGCITAYKARLKVSNTADDYCLLRVMIDEDRAQEEINCCLSDSIDSSNDSSRLLAVKGYFKHEDRLYLVSDFIPETTSCSLRAIAKERSSTRPDGLPVLTLDELCDLTFQLINVLAVLHARPGKKISHGDIRPENILCCVPDSAATADPHVMMMIAETTANYVLTNFNNKTFSPTHRMTTMRKEDGEEHPENYYAPEILYLFEAAGEANKTAAGDIWSLGATLLNLSVGFVITDVKAKQLTWRFDNDVLSCFSPDQQSLWHSSVPVWVKEVIVQCLCCVAKTRPTAVSLQQEDQIGYIKYKKGYDAIQQQAFLLRELRESRAHEESLLLVLDNLKEDVRNALTAKDSSRQEAMKAKVKHDKMTVERDQIKEAMAALSLQFEELQRKYIDLAESNRLQATTFEKQLLKLQRQSSVTKEKCEELIACKASLQVDLTLAQEEVSKLQTQLLVLNDAKLCQDTIIQLETENESLRNQKQTIQIQYKAAQKSSEEMSSRLTTEVIL